MSAASRDAHAEVQEIALDERETNTPRPNSNSPSRNKQALVQVAPSLERFISKVISDSTEAATLTANVLQFLGHRAQRDWLANELGCIV
ncbi:hypothetical protein [Burkholderia vietnamiensis]|nr:hypothetical protein [Burkholderia vietnamiensis]